MPAEYRTVEGDISTIDVLTNLTTFGGETTGPVKVPESAKRLVGLFVAAGIHNDTAGDNATIVVRLSGKGVTRGQQDIAIAGSGTGVTSTGTTFGMSTFMELDLEVTANENINVAAMPTGDTVLIATVAVTLIFEV